MHEGDEGEYRAETVDLSHVRAGGKEQQFGRFNEQQAARLL